MPRQKDLRQHFSVAQEMWELFSVVQTGTDMVQNTKKPKSSCGQEKSGHSRLISEVQV